MTTSIGERQELVLAAKAELEDLTNMEKFKIGEFIVASMLENVGSDGSSMEDNVILDFDYCGFHGTPGSWGFVVPYHGDLITDRYPKLRDLIKAL